MEGQISPDWADDIIEIGLSKKHSRSFHLNFLSICIAHRFNSLKSFHELSLSKRRIHAPLPELERCPVMRFNRHIPGGHVLNSMDSDKPSAREIQLCLLAGLGEQRQADSSQKKIGKNAKIHQ